MIGKYVLATSLYGSHISIVTYFIFVLSSLGILENNRKSVILLLESSTYQTHLDPQMGQFTCFITHSSMKTNSKEDIQRFDVEI